MEASSNIKVLLKTIKELGAGVSKSALVQQLKGKIPPGSLEAIIAEAINLGYITAGFRLTNKGQEVLRPRKSQDDCYGYSR